MDGFQSMDPHEGRQSVSQTRSPLISIGLIVMGMLTIPVLLYSTSPDGPVKEGDVVFSTGKHRAYFAQPREFEQRGYQDFCVLEKRDQLVTLTPPSARPDGTFLAKRVGGNPKDKPYCPLQAVLVLKSHQVSLKAEVLGEIHDALVHLFPGD